MSRAAAVLLLATVALALALSPPRCLAREGSRDETELRSIVKEYYAAWNSGDAARAGVYYAKDPDLVFYDVTPLEYRGWDAYAAGATELFFKNATSASLAPHDDLRVTRHGRIAWTTVTFRLMATFKDGRSLDVEGRHTAIWERRGARWLIVHEHVSTPLKG